MLTPEQITALRDAAVQLTDPVVRFLVSDIAQRVAEAGQLTSTAAYETWITQQLGVSQAEMKRRLRKLLRTSAKDIDRLLTQTAETGYRFDLERLPHADAVPFEKNEALQQMVSGVSKMATEDFKNLSESIGMVDMHGKALPLRDAYRAITNDAFRLVSTGATDYNTAIRRATKQLSAKGIRVIDYESGVHTSIEAATRRNVMGAMGLLQEQMAEQNFAAMGADGWEISAHAACAEDHEPIQGKQFKDAAFRKLNNSLKRRIGTLNCGHVAHPIIWGVSKPVHSEAELERMRQDNEKGLVYEGKHYTLYEATQQQRKLETAIRTQKRRALLAEGNPADGDRLLQSQIRLRRLEQEYKRFSKTTKLPMQHERLETVGFGAGHARRATAAARAEVAKYEKIRYNEDGRIVVTDDWTQKAHPRLLKEYQPNAVVDTLSRGGKQHDRAIYDGRGKLTIQVHGGNHGNAKNHPFGKHGEHIHDVKWDDEGNRVKIPARDWSEEERKQHADLLGGAKDDKTKLD